MTQILIRILFLVAVAGGGFYVANQNGLVENPQLINEIEGEKENIQGSVKGITDNISTQTQDLTARGQEVSEHISNILGTYIKPTAETENSSENESSSENQNKPIYEETLNYGRYLYCQQVIQDYKEQHP